MYRVLQKKIRMTYRIIFKHKFSQIAQLTRYSFHTRVASVARSVKYFGSSSIFNISLISSSNNIPVIFPGSEYFAAIKGYSRSPIKFFFYVTKH